MIRLVEIECRSEECRHHHPAVSFIFQRQRSDAIISPPWLGCSSQERWKSIIDFIVQRFAMVGLICEQGGGDNNADTVIGRGGFISIIMIVANIIAF